MASRRQEKEQARAARIAAAESERLLAVRRRRRWIFSGILLMAGAVVAVVVAIGSSGGGSGLLPSSQASRVYRQVERQLAGVPQSGVRLGERYARVTMTYVGDLECPYCRAFTLSVLPRFIAAYVRSGKAKVVYRSLCTATCHFNSSRFVPQQVAAYAAGKQRLFWDYAELFYREQEDESQPYVTEHYLRSLARQIPNLDFEKWLAERQDPALRSQVRADQTFVTRNGLPEQTPEIVMSGPAGSESLPENALPTPAWLSSAVEAVS